MIVSRLPLFLILLSMKAVAQCQDASGTVTVCHDSLGYLKEVRTSEFAIAVTAGHLEQVASKDSLLRFWFGERILEVGGSKQGRIQLTDTAVRFVVGAQNVLLRVGQTDEADSLVRRELESVGCRAIALNLSDRYLWEISFILAGWTTHVQYHPRWRRKMWTFAIYSADRRIRLNYGWTQNRPEFISVHDEARHVLVELHAVRKGGVMKYLEVFQLGPNGEVYQVAGQRLRYRRDGTVKGKNSILSIRHNNQ